MARPSRYPGELRERAVRTVAEVRPDYPSEAQAIASVAQRLGIGSPETVRTWLHRVQIEAVAHALNTRPRKTLGWKTPAEAFNEQLLLLQQAGVASTG